MSTVLQITELDVKAIRQGYLTVRITLENVGTERLGVGQVLARQTSKDGSVQTVEFFNTVDLSPGERTKLSQLLSGVVKEIDFMLYRTSDGEMIPLSALAKRGLFRWSLDSAA
jgi:hypothetical protein